MCKSDSVEHDARSRLLLDFQTIRFKQTRDRFLKSEEPQGAPSNRLPEGRIYPPTMFEDG